MKALHERAIEFNERFEAEMAHWKIHQTHGPWLMERLEDLVPPGTVHAPYTYEWITGNKAAAERHCRLYAISQVLHDMGVT